MRQNPRHIDVYGIFEKILSSTPSIRITSHELRGSGITGRMPQCGGRGTFGGIPFPMWNTD
jgi:hypothetical protein